MQVSSHAGVAVDFRVEFEQMGDEAPFYLDDWCKLLGKTRSAVYSMRHRNKLPHQVNMGEEGLTWRVGMVRAWLTSLPIKVKGSAPASAQESTGPVTNRRGRPRRAALGINGKPMPGEFGAST